MIFGEVFSVREMSSKECILIKQSDVFGLPFRTCSPESTLPICKVSAQLTQLAWKRQVPPVAPVWSPRWCCRLLQKWLLATAFHSILTLHHLPCGSVTYILERKSNPIHTQNKAILPYNHLHRVKPPLWNRKPTENTSKGIIFDDRDDWYIIFHPKGQGSGRKIA